MKAWHFTNGRLGYGDGRKVKTGRTYKVVFPRTRNGIIYHKPALCRMGLHASKEVCDAYIFKPHAKYITRVDLSGNLKHEYDKSVGTTRKVLAMANARQIMREFRKWYRKEGLFFTTGDDCNRKLMQLIRKHKPHLLAKG